MPEFNLTSNTILNENPYFLNSELFHGQNIIVPETEEEYLIMMEMQRMHLDQMMHPNQIS